MANGAVVNALHPPSAGDVASKLTPRFSPLSSIFADVSSGSKDEYSMLLILEYLLNKGAFVHWRQVPQWNETDVEKDVGNGRGNGRGNGHASIIWRQTLPLSHYLGSE